jgi:ABC-type multidrug transport system ATPase subunit
LSHSLPSEIPIDELDLMPDPSEAQDAMIATRALTRTFKGGVQAVRGIDMTVARGEVFGFLGPNGAGKTTTVRMLCTLLPPTNGSAAVAGYDVAHAAKEVRRRIGVALQEIGLDPVQTGRELLTTQYLEEADKLCNRLAIIDGGTIVAEGTPEQLKTRMGRSCSGWPPPPPAWRW